MSYLLNIHFEVEPELWNNFSETEGGPEFTPDDATFTERFNTWIDEALSKYNAWDDPGTTCIYFETKEDAIMFKLRFC